MHARQCPQPARPASALLTDIPSGHMHALSAPSVHCSHCTPVVHDDLHDVIFVDLSDVHAHEGNLRHGLSIDVDAARQEEVRSVTAVAQVVRCAGGALHVMRGILDICCALRKMLQMLQTPPVLS